MFILAFLPLQIIYKAHNFNAMMLKCPFRFKSCLFKHKIQKQILKINHKNSDP